MSTGFWINADGLPLQFGTQKAIPEMGGDYLMYGESREVEVYIPMVPTTWATGTGYVSVPAPPTSLTFTGTGSTPATAGIQSMTNLFPLQLTAPQSASSSALTLSNTQLFIERVELLCLQTASTGQTMTVGLVTTSSPANSSSATSGSFVQVTPSAGFQLIGTSASTGLTINSTVGTAGAYTLFAANGVQGATFTGGATPWTATTGNAGAWVATNVPLVTNTLTPLPANAWISVLTNGAFTSGLFKLRVKYFIYGNISY